MGREEFAKVRSLGELAYGRSKERQAFASIACHTRRFLLLTAERFVLFWLPNMRRPWQSLAEAVLTLLGLCGLVSLVWKRHQFTWVVVPVLISFLAVYYVIQASGRYRFSLEPILFLRAANLFAGMRRSFVSTLPRWRESRLPWAIVHPDAQRAIPGNP